MTDKKTDGTTNEPGNPLLNLLTSIFLLASVLLIAYFGYTFVNPHHSLNPFAPPMPIAGSQPTTPTLTAVPTETSIPVETQPNETETSVPPPSETPQAEPAATLPAFPTATSVVINTPEPTLTTSPLKFVAQDGTPSYLPYSGGCSGLYIAGNITDIDDNPVMLMTVRASGTLGSEDILIEALSGSNTDYTVSGWEIKLSDTLIASTGTITVALYEQGGWDPISEEVAIDTFNDCSRNLIVVNFIQE